MQLRQRIAAIDAVHQIQKAKDEAKRATEECDEANETNKKMSAGMKQKASLHHAQLKKTCAHHHP